MDEFVDLVGINFENEEEYEDVHFNGYWRWNLYYFFDVISEVFTDEGYFPPKENFESYMRDIHTSFPFNSNDPDPIDYGEEDFLQKWSWNTLKKISEDYFKIKDEKRG